MNKKLIGALFVTIFAFSSVNIITISFSIDQNLRGTQISSNDLVIEDLKTSASNFYEDIGTIYNVRTDDRVTIKLLRYHAPGKDFNYDGEPILLFPGLMSNINQYLIYTTPDIDMYFDPTLPNSLAPWAVGDENIIEDPLLYYSIAYYLWSLGYDPWFANYRGVGYGSMKSGGGDTSTQLDDFAIYDVKAAVRKVYDVTHKHPYIGGHSTGGLTSIIYLEGCYYNWYGHVYSSNRAVAERNGDRDGPETVKGFIGLEPAWIPTMSSDFDNLLVWMLFNTGLVLDLRAIVALLLAMMEMPIIGDLINILIQLVINMFGGDINELFLLLNIDITNVDAIMLYYFLTYGIDTLFLLTMAQYGDYATFNRVREYYKNGWFNYYYIRPPTPRRRDGYYYYDVNVYKFKVPAIFFFASHQNDEFDLVNRDLAISGIVESKSNKGNDECYTITGAHIDMPSGLRAPVDVFPKLGDWLANN